MINLGFNIRNPWSNRFGNVFAKYGKTPFPNKFWELEILKTTDIIGFHVDLSMRQSHAGLRVAAALFGYEIVFDFYDHRHWDHANNIWGKHDV